MRLAFVALAVTMLAACPPNEPPPPPPSPPIPVYAPPDGGAVTPISLVDAAPAAHAGSSADAAEQPGSVTRGGASCASAADCDSGVCEGLGCGADAPGRCADKRRMCTMDLIDFCGCDDQTFQSSSSCPGRRYAHRGGCTQANQGPPPPPAKKHAGDACLAGDECESGLCEGEGCGDDAPGRCADVAKKCTRDRRPYCGCDGQTFMTSGSCPGHRYAHKGKC